MRVVIINDDEPQLRAMQEWVSHAGHEVLTFGRFEPAKTYLATAQTDVVVTDVRLGAFNGLHLVMVAKGGHPETTAIVLAGSEDSVLRRDAANLGARFCLKPIGSEQLLRAIDPAAGESAED
jgi:DNA-binding NtrC family response regulator